VTWRTSTHRFSDGGVGGGDLTDQYSPFLGRWCWGRWLDGPVLTVSRTVVLGEVTWRTSTHRFSDGGVGRGDLTDQYSPFLGRWCWGRWLDGPARTWRRGMTWSGPWSVPPWPSHPPGGAHTASAATQGCSRQHQRENKTVRCVCL